jgi:hypothetical protein
MSKTGGESCNGRCPWCKLLNVQQKTQGTEDQIRHMHVCSAELPRWDHLANPSMISSLTCQHARG